MTIRKLLLTGWACALAVASPLASAQETFGTRLDTVPIDFRTREVTTGDGHVTARLSGRELTVSGRFEGLSGTATEAWLRMGTAIGARGPAIHKLTVTPAASGEITGSVTLSRAEAAALEAGRIYLQLHSDVAPEGNLWGWLLPEDDR